MPDFVVEFITAIVFGMGVSLGVFISGLVILIAASIFFRGKL